LTVQNFNSYYNKMLAQWIIEKKRNGRPLSQDEIAFFIQGYARGEIPDYQMSALAMAIYFKGMTFPEVTALTDSMIRSGKVLTLSSIKKQKVDKHSTGGIGDKVSLILAPLVACCEIAVPMMSGRGLGITGGTLDKMESIPGYRVNLKPYEFISVLKKCGCSMIGQTPELVPADRKLYALRDVTATVPSIPLISASIMSKKIAEGSDSLVLDVKWGKGAFMKTRLEAKTLARTMVEIGKRMGKGMVAILTDMNQPLGRSVGNAVEVIECIETLKGNGPDDLVEITLTLGAHMLLLGQAARSKEQALNILQNKITSGAAFNKFREMVNLHGGKVEYLNNPSQLPHAKHHFACPSPRSGYVSMVDAELIGRACIILGAGRKTIDDKIDHAAGITGIVKIGEKVNKGQPLLILHANERKKLTEAGTLIGNAIKLGREHVRPPKLVTDLIK